MLQKFYSGFQFLNLDVVLGAVGWHLAFLRFPDGRSEPWQVSVFILALLIWVIYVLDRILDTYRGQIDTPRHQFHARHEFNLMVGSTATLLVSLVLVFFLPKPVLLLGIGLLLAVICYFYIIHRLKKRPKNLKLGFIPMVYGLAVIGTAWVQLPSLTLSMWLIGAQWFLILVQNMRLFQYFEKESLAARTPPIVRWIGVMQAFVHVLLFGGQTTFPAWISLLLTLVSVLYSLLPTLPKASTSYRRWIDGLLLTGWLAFFF